jgi:Nif-specific regulatory protein
LRVLQEREFERVGGAKPIKVDVRLVFATNRNLEKMVREGEFRSDLYYRINVVSIFLPPLRERREDIPALAAQFLERYNRENLRNLRLAPDGLEVLLNCHWPGNVRELENCVERTATMCASETIDECAFLCHKNRCLTQMLHHLEKDDAVAPANLVQIEMPERLVNARRTGDEGGQGRAGESEPAPSPGSAVDGGSEDADLEGERERLLWAMEQSRGVQAKAARLLKITPRQLGYALQKHNIKVRKF